MKNITLLLVFLISLVGFSQEAPSPSIDSLNTATNFSPSKATSDADESFRRLAFVKAAKQYKRLSEDEPTGYIFQQLGDSYYNYGAMKSAEQAYEYLFTRYDNSKIGSEYYFRYAQTLRGNGKYKESDEWMKKFKSIKTGDKRGEYFASSVGTQPSLLENPMYMVSNLRAVNTEYSDFGGELLRDSVLVFASAKPSSRFIKRVHSWNNKPFYNLYKINTQDGSAFKSSSVQLFSKRLSTIYHESSVSFVDDDLLFFTRNNYANDDIQTDSEGTSKLKIYSSSRDSRGRWQEGVSVPFNSDDYSVGHPSISHDGKRMYFTSDMPGSLGQTDIYYVELTRDIQTGTISYGEPINAGATINTEGREMFPYIASDGTLYFSSDGHYGLGGLDVFGSKQVDGVFQTPYNLRAPINTPSDDFDFKIDPKERRGYLSSNRTGGKGDDDIYTVKELDIEVKEEKKCYITKRGTVREKGTEKIIPYATVTLSDSAGKVLEVKKAGSDGRFSFDNVECEADYKVVGEKMLYDSDMATFRANEATADLELSLNLALNKDFERSHQDEIIIKIDNIYFDFDKSNIRPDAEIELRKIVAVMKKYPNIIIESGSHTDARGTFAYNESLSDRRAKSSVAWIVSRGIDPSRISGRGYGESQLVNGCVDNDRHTNRVKCSEEEHQQNRRTEFRIVRQ